MTRSGTYLATTRLETRQDRPAGHQGNRWEFCGAPYPMLNRLEAQALLATVLGEGLFQVGVCDSSYPTLGGTWTAGYGNLIPHFVWDLARRGGISVACSRRSTVNIITVMSCHRTSTIRRPSRGPSFIVTVAPHGTMIVVRFPPSEWIDNIALFRRYVSEIPIREPLFFCYKSKEGVLRLRMRRDPLT